MVRCVRGSLHEEQWQSDGRGERAERRGGGGQLEELWRRLSIAVKDDPARSSDRSFAHEGDWWNRTCRLLRRILARQEESHSARRQSEQQGWQDAVPREPYRRGSMARSAGRCC